MRRNFWEIIYRFSEEGRTIFVTTHYMDEAEHCNRIALIISGEIIALDSPDALKKDFPYRVYSIATKDFIGAFKKIRGLDFVIEAAIFGSDIHILCEGGSRIRKRIDSFFRESGFHPYRINAVMPSLEDVFVSSARRFNL